VAVSKGHTLDAIRAAAALGVEHFAENYMQEALPKIEALAGLALTWHFIGRLQANKTRHVAERFDWVHGLDRLQIAARLSAQRQAYSRPLNVCVQINLAGEAAKAGVSPSCGAELVQAVGALPRLRLRGLMCMLPEGQSKAARHVGFAALRTLLERLNQQGTALDSLSMGMSDDFEEAIMEGATLVRIGTAIFGPR
jgi:pyridoxal phosphate enzyme (YggS family)